MRPITDEVINKELVKYLTEKYNGIWREADAEAALPERVFESKEKKELENKLDGFIAGISPQKRFIFFRRRKEINIEEKLAALYAIFSESALMGNKELIQNIPVNDFIAATKEFVKKSRQFDSSLTNDDIYQACRNVWIMNIIQQMAGLNVEITPSVLAYSLLYPFCDNFIDDVNISLAQKIEFGERLKQRLNGKNINPENLLEEKVYNLIEMIEDEYDRTDYPQVYESLLAIHRAQIKSLSMQLSAKGVTENEMLEIHIEKGGTSVLADGCLILGSLTEEQMEFVFGLGAYLQFTDDMQDISEDCSTGNFSIYAGMAQTGALDEYAMRTFSFGRRTLEKGGCLRGENENAYIEMLKAGMDIFIAVLIGMLDEYYSPRFVKTIEKYSPMSFAYIKKNYKKYSERGMLLLERLGA